VQINAHSHSTICEAGCYHLPTDRNQSLNDKNRDLSLSLLLPTDGIAQALPSCLLALYDEQLYVRPNIHLYHHELKAYCKDKNYKKVTLLSTQYNFSNQETKEYGKKYFILFEAVEEITNCNTNVLH